MSQAQKHEQFVVEEAPAKGKSRLKVVRQDRFEPKGKASLKIDGTSYDVSNYSAFGVAVISAKPFPDGHTVAAAALRFDSTEMTQLALRLVRQEKIDGSENYHVAFEITSRPLDIAEVDAILEAEQLVGELKEELTSSSLVPPDFRHKVYETKDGLTRLQSRLTELRSTHSFTSTVDSDRFDGAVMKVVSDFLFEVFQPTYKQLSACLKGKDTNVVKAAFAFFRAQLKEMLYQSPFSERCYTKPLGYAGDYEMMNLIYRNEVIGSSLFAKCLHHYYLHHPETKAVRNRGEYLYGILASSLAGRKPGSPINFLSVASGPAREVQMICENHKKHDLQGARFDLLDQDLVSLKHAQQELRAIIIDNHLQSTVNVNYVNKAIRNLIQEGLSEGSYDVIYSAGLFDYFSDPVAQMAARVLMGALKPGGQLIIGNFNITTPNQFLMEIVLDWNLIYRSGEDLQRLYGKLGKGFEIDEESEGVNLFCRITK